MHKKKLKVPKVLKVKLDVSSESVEKITEHTVSFVKKIIGRSIKELGLMLMENVRSWRFQNQIKILDKTEKYCRERNISPTRIPVKLLAPLLENSSLEEEEYLQDKWATLLGNMLDSEQNLQNHVFPYILSQISVKEYSVLEKAYNAKQKLLEPLHREYRKVKKEMAKIENELYACLNGWDYSTALLMYDDVAVEAAPDEIKSELKRIYRKLEAWKKREADYYMKTKEPQHINRMYVLDYQLTNLVRLGVVKLISKSEGTFEHKTIPNRAEKPPFKEGNYYIGISNIEEYYLSDLGERLIDACTAKEIKKTKKG